MGFFDKILSAIGFESEEEDVEYEEKPRAEKKRKREDLTSAKFDLSKEIEPSSRELSRFGTNNEEEDEEDLEIHTPESQSDIERLLIKVKNGENALINLANFSEEDRVRALDFISGALFLLNRKIKKIEGTLFLISK